MLLKFLRFLFGYVKVEIKGFAPERLMNLLMENDILAWDIEKIDQGYIFFIGRKNLTNIKPFLQKTNVKLKILQKYGIVFWMKRRKKQSFFLCGIFLFICMLYIFSQFIWEVKISCEDEIVRNNLLKTIETKYVPLGTRKNTINCEEIEDKLLADNKDLSWISCTIKGTTLFVDLYQDKNKTTNIQELKKGNIVAKIDCVITKIITRDGTPIANVNDQVKKGDILISDTIYLYDDQNEVLETDYVVADGDVYGRANIEYEDYVDLEHYEKKYKKETKNFYTVFFMNYFITPFQPKLKTKQYEKQVETHKINLFSDLYLPIGYKKNKVLFYDLKRSQYKDEEAKKILENRIYKKIKELEEKGVEIIENNVKIYKKGNTYYAKGSLFVEESIGVLQN